MNPPSGWPGAGWQALAKLTRRQHGDITDPPVSVAKSSSDNIVPAAQRPWAVSRDPNLSFSASFSAGPPESPTLDSVFCATCLKNQHSYAEALSRYEFPDDNNDPEYAERMRAFRRWKSHFESMHPQVCTDCEPKVEAQLNKASYTAQTDHLRRMMDRTRARRREVKKRGVLDLLDVAGKWTWHFAFFLQLVWHALELCSLFVYFQEKKQSEQDGPEDWILGPLARICRFGLRVTPSSARLVRWTINVGFVSIAWNPRFKQTVRGFTSHILGLRQWYTYQLIILFIRCACLFVSQYNDTKAINPTSQLAAHLFISLLMLYIYRLASTTIRTDTRPLFGTIKPFRSAPNSAPNATTPTDGHPNKPQQTRHDDMASILDEIATSTPSRGLGPENHPGRGFSPSPPGRLMGTSSPLGRQNSPFGATPQRSSPLSGLGPLRHAEGATPTRPAPPPMQGGEEMDWAPSSSQHRAFSNHNPFRVKNPNPRFSDAPIAEKPGPFWFKVPPAPTTPAQRVRNPPMRPMIREKALEIPENFFQPSRRGRLDLGSPAPEAGSSFVLKNPSFHAPEPKDDPRDGLSRMMGSFSISPDPEEFSSRRSTVPREVTELQNSSKVRTAELMVLIGALWIWQRALATQEVYGPTLGLGAICAGLMVSVRLTADLLVDAQLRDGKPPPLLQPSWANLGMVQIMATLVLVWKVWAENDGNGITCGAYGNGLIGVMVAHQIMHVFG